MTNKEYEKLTVSPNPQNACCSSERKEGLTIDELYERYVDVVNRLSELEDMIDNGELVFVPEPEPKYQVFVHTKPVMYEVVEFSYEPKFEITHTHLLPMFETLKEAEKYAEELNNEQKRNTVRKN